MSAHFKIVDGNGANNKAQVTNRGQLVVAPLDFSDPIENDLVCACVGTNFFAPKANKQVVITDIFIHTDRNTPVAGIIIEVYESDSATSLTVDKCIFKIDLGRQLGVGHSGINFLINEGKWLNAKISVSTGTTSVTVAGYFIGA